MTDALLAYSHFLSIGLLAILLSIEWLLCGPSAKEHERALLARIDLAYFGAAILVLASGVLRVFFGAKGAAFYADNPVFWGKLALFVLIGLASIRPTLIFRRWARKGSSEADVLPSELAAARRWLALELGLLILIPLAAVMMARGIGH